MVDYTNWDKFNDALEKGVKCLCDEPLDVTCRIDMYDHDEGGISVPNHYHKQWVSVHCKNKHCQYDMSWNKVIRRAKENE